MKSRDLVRLSCALVVVVTAVFVVPIAAQAAQSASDEANPASSSAKDYSATVDLSNPQEAASGAAEDPASPELTPIQLSSVDQCLLLNFVHPDTQTPDPESLSDPAVKAAWETSGAPGQIANNLRYSLLSSWPDVLGGVEIEGNAVSVLSTDPSFDLNMALSEVSKTGSVSADAISELTTQTEPAQSSVDALCKAFETVLPSIGTVYGSAYVDFNQATFVVVVS